jgi:hypothetical protein
MHFIYVILIFCIVLFLYLHVYFHLKTSNDLEIYEIDHPSKDKLEEICDLKQPVFFNFNNERILETCQRHTILDTYGAFDVKIRNIVNEKDTNIYVPLAFSNALKLVKEDRETTYLVENNGDFLEETGIIKSYKYNDAFLRPYMVSHCAYDFLMAGAGVRTPFRYELNYRNYLLVAEGAVKVKMAPPKSSKYLYPQNDYENLEFSSPLNPWDIQAQYKADFDKIKCLDVRMTKGQILYLPPYWWYSIEFGQEASVCSFKYKTYMNTVSILPQLVMKVLQTQNVKRNHMEKMKMVAVKEEIPKGDALSNPTSSGIAPTSSGIAPTVSIMGSSIDIMPTILEEPSSYSSIQSTEINNLPL